MRIKLEEEEKMRIKLEEEEKMRIKLEEKEKMRIKFEEEANEKEKMRILYVDIKNEMEQINLEQKRSNKEKQQELSIIVGGSDEYNQLGESPNNEAEDIFSSPIINPPLNLSLDSSSLLSYSISSEHSVVVKRDGSLLGIGNNRKSRISCSLTKTIIKQFTEFSIKDDNSRQLTPISSFCSGFGTLYMFSKISGHRRQLVTLFFLTSVMRSQCHFSLSCSSYQ